MVKLILFIYGDNRIMDGLTNDFATLCSSIYSLV